MNLHVCALAPLWELQDAVLNNAILKRAETVITGIKSPSFDRVAATVIEFLFGTKLKSKSEQIN